MPRLKLVEPGGNEKDVEKIYEEIIQDEGFINDLNKTLANYPPALLSYWEKTKAIFYGGSISATLKHEIFTLISEQRGFHS